MNIGEHSPQRRLGEYSPIFTSLRRIIVKYKLIDIVNLKLILVLVNSQLYDYGLTVIDTGWWGELPGEWQD